jgi:hypothetical protein
MQPFKRKGQAAIKLGKRAHGHLKKKKEKEKEKDLTALAFLIRTLCFHAIFRKIQAFSHFLSRFFMKKP